MGVGFYTPPPPTFRDYLYKFAWSVTLVALGACRDLLLVGIEAFFTFLKGTAWGLYAIDALTDSLGLEYYDWFVVIFSVCVIFWTSRAGWSIIGRLADLLRAIIVALQGRPVVYPTLDKYNMSTYAPKKDGRVVNESYFSPRHLLTKIDGMPPGAVQLFVELEDGRLEFMGHGTFVGNGTINTSLHVIEDAIDAGLRIFAGVLGKDKALPIKVKQVDRSLHYAELYAGNVPAVLGVKAVKVKLATQGLVEVYSFNCDEKCYYVGSSPIDSAAEVAKYGYHATVLTTKSDTHGGDSGLSVYQKGAQVAIHRGGDDTIQRNIHIIPLALLGDEIRKARTRIDRIFKTQQRTLNSTLKNESPNVVGRDEDRIEGLYEMQLRRDEERDREEREEVERARHFQEKDDEFKRKRMLGEHEDDQGFRRSKMDQPKLKGKAWADIDDEDVVIGNGKAHVVDESDEAGKSTAPTAGAVEVPVSTTSQPLPLLDATLPPSTKVNGSESIVSAASLPSLVPVTSLPKSFPRSDTSLSSPTQTTPSGKKRKSASQRLKEREKNLKQKISDLEKQLGSSTTPPGAAQ